MAAEDRGQRPDSRGAIGRFRRRQARAADHCPAVGRERHLVAFIGRRRRAWRGAVLPFNMATASHSEVSPASGCLRQRASLPEGRQPMLRTLRRRFSEVKFCLWMSGAFFPATEQRKVGLPLHVAAA